MDRIVLNFLAIIFSLCFTKAQSISLAECGKTLGCFKEPASCTSEKNCDYSLTYTYVASSKTVDITVSTKKRWIALGLNELQQMDQASGEVCFRGSGNAVSMKAFVNNGYSPDWARNMQGLSIKDMYDSNGAIVCKYSRPVTPPTVNSGAYMRDLSNNLHIVLAYGTSLTNGGDPRYHERGNYKLSPSLNMKKFVQPVPTTAPTTTQATTTKLTTTTPAPTTTAKPTTNPTTTPARTTMKRPALTTPAATEATTRPKTTTEKEKSSVTATNQPATTLPRTTMKVTQKNNHTVESKTTESNRKTAAESGVNVTSHGVAATSLPVHNKTIPSTTLSNGPSKTKVFDNRLTNAPKDKGKSRGNTSLALSVRPFCNIKSLACLLLLIRFVSWS